MKDPSIASDVSDDHLRAEGRRTEKPAPFVHKLLQILESSEYAHIVQWSTSEGGVPAFTISDTAAFSKSVLPQFFKHNKLSSFVQQLHTYGFRRCSEAGSSKGSCRVIESSSSITFQHDLLSPSQPELLLQIRRGNACKEASAACSGAAASAGSSYADEVNRLAMEVEQDWPCHVLQRSLVDRSPRDACVNLACQTTPDVKIRLVDIPSKATHASSAVRS